MENATKALLIAAAVLIVIVIIALGVRLLNTAADTSGQAEQVSNEMSQTIQTQTNSLTNSLSVLKVTN